MKLYVVALPLACSLALAGGVMMWHSQGAPQGQDISQENVGIDFSQIQTRHFVTKEMEIETSAMANLRGAKETGTSDTNQTLEIAPKGAKRPQFMLFIKDGCPCSIDAQPLFNRLAKRFAGKVDFVGVIDGNRDHARDYATQFSVAFPVVADPNEKIIHDYKATAGTFSVLIARNGHIVKMWPGYSASTLQKMNAMLAQESGVQETPFDPQYAPIKETSGCAFVSKW